MVIQFGDNPEYTMYLFTDLKYWALPLTIYWQGFDGDPVGINFSITIKILCFGFEFEIWKWRKKNA